MGFWDHLKGTPSQRLRRKQLLAASVTTLEKLASFAEKAHALRSEVTLHTALSFAHAALAAVPSNPHFDPKYARFQGGGNWIALGLGDFSLDVQEAVRSACGGATQKMDDIECFFASVGGHELVFRSYGGRDCTDGYALVPEGADALAVREESRREVGRIMWETHGTSVVVSGMADKSGKHLSSGANLPGKRSALADDQVSWIQACLRSSVTRTVMLCGHPGAGKTEMARYIAACLGRHTLYMDAEALATGLMRAVMACMRPDVVIIEDFDHYAGAESQVQALDSIREYVRVLILTVNDPSVFNGAEARPGRFDEVLTVKNLVDIREVFPGIPGWLVPDVEEWEVAFLKELETRAGVLETLGLDDAELRRRLGVEYERLRRRQVNNHVKLSRAIDFQRHKYAAKDKDEEEEDDG